MKRCGDDKMKEDEMIRFVKRVAEAEMKHAFHSVKSRRSYENDLELMEVEYKDVN